MQCFDCASEQGRGTDAVAVCATCGAGMCTDHTTLGYAESELRSPGNPTVHRLPGRRLFCGSCACAYTEAGALRSARKVTAVG